MISGRKKKYFERLGVCIRDLEGTVVYQNRSCLQLCSNQKGKQCSNGCIKIYNHNIKPQKVYQTHLLRNQKMKNTHCDLMYVRDKYNAATFILMQESEHAESLENLRSLGLTNREVEIYDLLLAGLANSEIAESLFISKATLKTHLNNIYRKIGTSEDLRPRKRT